MKQFKIIFILLLCCFTAGQVQAQELTDEQKKIFQERVKQKVEEFTFSLARVVDNSLSHNVRKANVNMLFCLFIGEAGPYSYFDEELKDTIYSSGVRMQVSSVSRTYKSNRSLKEYVHRLYNPETRGSSLSYSKIVIESADAVRVDNIERVGNRYECVASFTQRFIGFRDGKVEYIDETTKRVRCYIDHTELPTGETIWDAKLGDIYVVSTKRI